MRDNYAQALNYVLQSEGGFINDPDDSGGATNKGITLAVFKEYKRNNHLTLEDLKNISNSDVYDIYKKLYWDRVYADNLNSGCDYACFDFAVNAGVARSVKLAQGVVGANVDGIMGPATLALCNRVDTLFFINAFSNSKREFYESIVKNKPTQEKFLKGWLNRIEIVKTNSLKFIGS